jgi:ribosome-associated protein YbcJ (S4-like RNA binding protein)
MPLSIKSSGDAKIHITESGTIVAEGGKITRRGNKISVVGETSSIDALSKSGTVVTDSVEGSGNISIRLVE